jgi:hypothetical protein
MQHWTAAERAEFRRLHAAYQEAWRRLSLQVGYWQSLVDGKADGLAIRQAEIGVAQAEAGYRERRDLLAGHMLARPAETPVVHPVVAEEAGSPACLTGTYY